MRLYADATGCKVVLPREADGVLLGTALLAATAAGHFRDLLAAGRVMVHCLPHVSPDPATHEIHRRGYTAFCRMLSQRQEVMDIAQGKTAQSW